MIFETKFAPGDRVFLDRDQSMCFTVTAFTFRQSRGPLVELSWVFNGDIKSAWVEEFRLTSATG